MTDIQNRVASGHPIDNVLPKPLSEFMAENNLNNPDAARYFNFSVPAIQKFLASKTRRIGVQVVHGVDKIVETKEIETLLLYSKEWEGVENYAFLFECPTSCLTVQVVEPRGPMKEKDD